MTEPTALTVAELIAKLQTFDPALPVRYNYDGGHGHQPIVDAYISTDPFNAQYGPHVVLDEDPQEFR